jgi:hypothetical protein
MLKISSKENKETINEKVLRLIQVLKNLAKIILLIKLNLVKH